MLVLTRRTDERIQIGQNITITILKVKGRSVKVGIEAPEGVQVVRTELLAEPSKQATLPPAAAPDDAGDSVEDDAEHGTDVAGASTDPPVTAGRRRSRRKTMFSTIAACWAL